MYLKLNICNEEQLEHCFFNFLEKKDWKTKRQVIADGTEKWKYPRKIDIITNHPDFKDLNPIGIELKYMRGSQRGGVISKAIQQVLKYRQHTFNGEKIKLWVVGIYTTSDFNIENSKVLFREFTNGFKIGYLNLNCLVYTTPHPVIDFAYTRGEQKIDIGKPPYGYHETNPKKIIELQKKILDEVEEFIIKGDKLNEV